MSQLHWTTGEGTLWGAKPHASRLEPHASPNQKYMVFLPGVHLLILNDQSLK